MKTITRFEANVLKAIGHVVQVSAKRGIVLVNGCERYRLRPPACQVSATTKAIREMKQS